MPMNEYSGESAVAYGQPQDKYYTLFPAIDRVLPQSAEKQSLVDLGCGSGDLYDFLIKKGYSYTGIDISDDMLQQARMKHPSGIFLQGDATNLTLEINQNNDVVLCNMLLPSISTKIAFDGVISTAGSLLSEAGVLIVTAGHPCFDGYMQKHFFNRENIETTFEGYFQSAANYKVHRRLEKGNFTFSDFHWTLTDYFQSAKKAGMQITAIDECPLVGKPPTEVVEKITNKGCPSYIVLSFKKLR